MTLTGTIPNMIYAGPPARPGARSARDSHYFKPSAVNYFEPSPHAPTGTIPNMIYAGTPACCKLPSHGPPV
jgi:hypothetical protein